MTFTHTFNSTRVSKTTGVEQSKAAATTTGNAPCRNCSMGSAASKRFRQTYRLRRSHGEEQRERGKKQSAALRATAKSERNPGSIRSTSCGPEERRLQHQAETSQSEHFKREGKWRSDANKAARSEQKAEASGPVSRKRTDGIKITTREPGGGNKYSTVR